MNNVMMPSARLCPNKLVRCILAVYSLTSKAALASFATIAAVLTISSCSRVSPASHTLQFKGDSFKIVQFTDLHWLDEDDHCKVVNDSTLKLMQAIIDAEQPDLAVLTGDVVTWNKYPMVLQCWQTLMDFFDKNELPYVMGFGNHDPENDTVSTRDVVKFLQNSKYNMTFDDDESLHGAGNCYLQILDQSGTAPVWNLYFFDSLTGSVDPRIKGYDWIHYDQIAWYNNLSDRLNADAKKPGLAFFHIPFPEYLPEEGDEVLGYFEEGVAGPRLNSGLYATLLEKDEVIGTFVGHDHNNDYVYDRNGIALCFGRKTGYNIVYHEVLARGARIINLHEHERSFDTYIVDALGTHFHYTHTR